MASGLGLVAVDLGSQCGLSYAPLGLAQAATNCRSLYSSCQMGLGQTQAVADLSLN